MPSGFCSCKDLTNIISAHEVMVSRAELLGVAAEIQANERDSTEFAPKTPQSLHAEGLLRGDEERERERERERELSICRGSLGAGCYSCA